jgi:molybdate transport system ATP-binding protein
MLKVTLYDERQPNLNVQFKCEPGQLLALVGPSGAGKSTVLRCIAGLHKASQGHILSAGNSWFDSSQNIHLTAQQRRVGFVFQNYALFPHLTVVENISLALDNSKDISKVESLLSQVRLTGLGQRYPDQLSGGQQQRVAIARALARDPNVLLLDEPFSAVDKVTRRKLYLELNSLRENIKIPIILVTHDLDEAAMLADTMVVIHRGETLQQDIPSELLHRPKNIEVAKLVDVRNLFDGRLVKDADEAKLEWNHHSLSIKADEQALVEAVHWTISPSKVILHQRLRPSRGEQENPVKGVITQLLTLRGITTVLLRVSSEHNSIIQMDLSEHVAVRNSLQVGDEITVSLISEAIHIIR